MGLDLRPSEACAERNENREATSDLSSAATTGRCLYSRAGLRVWALVDDPAGHMSPVARRPSLIAVRRLLNRIRVAAEHALRTAAVA